jgi:hypothetical protein
MNKGSIGSLFYAKKLQIMQFLPSLFDVATILNKIRDNPKKISFCKTLKLRVDYAPQKRR